MKKAFCAAATLLALTGCQPFDGQLHLSETTKFNLKKTIFGNTKTVRLSPGTYSAKLDFKSKDEARLNIYTAKDKYKVQLKTKDGDRIPRRYGNIALDADEIGQPFDLRGHIDTEETYSDNFNTTQSCTYTRKEKVCERDERDRRRDRRDRKGREGHGIDVQELKRLRCEYRDVTVTGRQQVEFHYKYTNSKIKLNLLRPRSRAVLGSFNGDRRESDKIYTFKGRCH